MNSVETPSPTSAPLAETCATPHSEPDSPQASSGPGQGPHFLVVLLFQDGRSADLVVPGVTGMGGSGDAAGPGRLNIYAPCDGPRETRRMVGARLFSDLADLTVVAEPLEIEIDEAPEVGG